MEHTFWFGMNRSTINIFVFFQMFAALGFLISVPDLLKNGVDGGILSNDNGARGLR